MTDYRELHYAGDVTADLVPGEPLGWDAGGRPYVIVQTWYDPPMAGRDFSVDDDPPPGRTTVVLAHPSPEQVRGWIDAGTWHPQVAESRRLHYQLAAHRADLRAAGT